MSRGLIVHRAGPAMTVQDLGRDGYLAFGLSRGGAADALALWEGSALLRQAPSAAALEMAGMGGVFEATEDIRVALTGAPMAADIDGTRIAWNASHRLSKGARLAVGATESGNYGYLHVGGGLKSTQRLRARSVHLAAGLGRPLSSGECLPVGADTGTETGQALPQDKRFDGGTIRVVASLQTDAFTAADITRFEATLFRRDIRGNRMGVRLLQDAEGFQSDAGLSVLSEVIQPGDIQITGDGTPFVLLSECQTTGGYPRVASVIPSDLPRVAQAQPGVSLRFAFVPLDEAVAIERREAVRRQKLRKACIPLYRDPATIPDLLSYRLISGATLGDDNANEVN